MDTTIYTQILPQKSVIMWFGDKDSVPSGWALCDGNKVQNSRGEEVQTPDLINRFVVGAGDQYTFQQTGGVNTVTLTVEQMPEHIHSGNTNQDGAHSHNNQVTARADNDDNDDPHNFLTDSSVDYYKSYVDISIEGSSHIHGFTTNPTGGGKEHENRPPYFALYFIIKID